MRNIPRGLLIVAALSCAGDASAQDWLRGPLLAAASNFGQGAQPRMFEAARAAGISDFRDAVYWAGTDDGSGQFTFDQPTTTWPDALEPAGAWASLTVNNGHPAYDGGATPHTDAGVAGFAAHAAALTGRFPAIHAIEVGNEFNGGNFVSGPVKQAGRDGRAAAYVALLRATHDAVKASSPGVLILGGGVHSIPVGYLAEVAALGGADLMDALVIHPYSTPPWQLTTQVEVLRRDPAWAAMPLEVTEFGDLSARTAAGHMLAAYCQMALSGVTRAVWYPLNERGDGWVPLIDKREKLTSAGRAYRLIAAQLEGQSVRDVSPDPFTRACLFGEDRLVIWGAPRQLDLSGGRLDAQDAEGMALDAGPVVLDWETPVLILSRDGPLDPAMLALAPQRLLADSRLQYTYPMPGQDQAKDDGFDRFVRSNAGDRPLITRPGQERDGVPWVPYRAARNDPMVRLTADTLLPGGTGAAPAEIVHRYRADTTGPVDLQIEITPADRSEDGVSVVLLHNSTELARETVTDRLQIERAGMKLAEGDTLEVVVGPNQTARGDVTDYRIRIWRAAE